jgi:tetratricopeptide (TPR) repeat protein
MDASRLLVAEGQLEGALPLLETALNSLQADLGPTHPSALAAIGSLANCLDRMGDYERALTLYDEVLFLIPSMYVFV